MLFVITFLHMFPPRKISFLLLATFSILCSQLTAGPKMNPRARALARHLGPSPSSKKVNSGDLASVKKRLVPILNILETTKRTNGPSPKDLLVQAYALRKDVGTYEAGITSAALISNWELARAAGLFADGVYTDRISNGSDRGEKIQMEHTVLPEKMPVFSAHLANVRLIEPSKKRGQDAEMSERDAAYQNQLTAITKEIKANIGLRKLDKPLNLNSVGQSMKEAEKRYQQEVKIAGEAAKEMPGIRLEGKVMATPSHKSGQRWRIEATISNISRIPTAIELEWYVIGITEKKSQRYIMAKGKQPLKLRKGQEILIDLYTKSKNSYKNPADDMDGLSKAERKKSKVRFRGFAFRVNHEKGIAQVAASDKLLHGFLDDEASKGISGLPNFSLPYKKVDEYQ